MDLFAHLLNRFGLGEDWRNEVFRAALVARLESLGPVRPAWHTRLKAIRAVVEAKVRPAVETELTHALWLMSHHRDPSAIENACCWAEHLVSLRPLHECVLQPGQYRQLDTRQWLIVAQDDWHIQPLPGGELSPQGPWLYPPRAGLFADVLAPAQLEHLYPPFGPPCDEHTLVRVGQLAWDHTERYSPDLAGHIAQTLTTVIAMPPTVQGLSSNLGLRYPRAIFINPWVRPNDPHLFATSLAHEYYHQCCWLLRVDGHFEGIIDPQQRIRSPMSGYDVDVPSMLDGLLIFLSNWHYFGQVFREGWDTFGHTIPLRERWQKLDTNLPVLHSLLTTTVRIGSPAAQYVAILGELYLALTQDRPVFS